MTNYYNPGVDMYPAMEPPPDYYAANNFTNVVTPNTHQDRQELIADSFTGPVVKRKRTNVEFLFLLLAFIFVWVLLVIYCVANGDLSRVLSKYNSSDFDDNNLKKIAKDIANSGEEIFWSSVIALALSAILIVLFRYFAGVIIWFVMYLGIALCIIASITFWVFYAICNQAHRRNHEAAESQSTAFFIAAIISTIFTIIISLIIYGIRKNIRFVICLFIEAGKSIQRMPLILLQPFATNAVIIVFASVWVYSSLWIESSGFEVIDHGTHEVTYEKDEIMQFARVYNVVALLWITQFIVGCQHMIVAGAVAKWFFTRDKDNLRAPLSTSYNYLFRYHLGSVAVGSLILVIIKIIRFLYKMTSALRNNNNPLIRLVHAFFYCIYRGVEKFIAYLTKNAYIEIAIYGDGFWTSGKRAFTVLTNNLGKVAVINSVGDFILFLGRLSVVVSSMGIGYLLLKDKSYITNIQTPLMMIGAIAMILSHCFMTTFEMAVDTIFICFYEDYFLESYQEDHRLYMSDELKQFIEVDNRVLRIGDPVEGMSTGAREATRK